MDTSETYIKMCDCKEVQGKHDLETHDSLEDGDFFAQEVLKDRPKGVFVFKELCPYCGPSPGIKITWLPRQDQIQEMMGLEDVGYLMNELMYFWQNDHLELIDDKCLFYKQEIDSMEHLWLAFYMHEEHKKIWTGENWIAVNNA